MQDITTFTLPNGIRVIHQHSSSPVCYCGLTINTGTRDELINEHGMAHFLEHVLFKGTAKRKAYHINNRLESVGGELNAFTTKEETVVHATTLTNDFARAIELITDICFHSIFPEKEVTREKEVIAEEIDSYRDSPSELIFDDYEDLLFSGSSLGRNILGNKRSIRRFTTDDIRNFIKRTYNTDQIIFSVIGAIPERRLVSCCNSFLAQEPSNTRAFQREAPPEYKVFQHRAKKKTHQHHCMLGNRTLGYTSNQRLSLALLVNLLGGPSANSILNTELREKRGLVYSIEANHSTYCDVGSVSIYYGTSKQNAEKSKEIIVGELTKLGTTLLSSQRLEKAKKQLIGQLAISNENHEAVMLAMGKSMLVHGRYESFSELAERINAINAESILELAALVFAPNMLSELVYY